METLPFVDFRPRRAQGVIPLIAENLENKLPCYFKDRIPDRLLDRRGA
jgi:hypothetical protein